MIERVKSTDDLLRRAGKTTIILQIFSVGLLVVLCLLYMDISKRYTLLQDGVRENAMWSVYQLDREARALDHGFDLALATPHGLDVQRKELATRFDILYSRMNLLKDSRFQDFFVGDKTISSSIADITEIVMGATKVFDHIKDPAKDNADEMKVVSGEIDFLIEKTQSFLTYTNARISEARADNRNAASKLEQTSAVFLILLIGTVLFLIVNLHRQLSSMREASASMEIMTRKLSDAYNAADAGNRAKSQFMATIGHEIRTPLNGILGMTQIMLRDASVPEETRDRINIVHGAGMTMRALVDDILDVAKMETGNLTVEQTATDLHATLHEVTRIWEEQARGKGLTFTLSHEGTPRWIETDPGRLRQIIFNLLSNAVKFTERGTLSVTVTAADERLALTIRDTGIGIPADKLDEVFESFRQVDAGTTRQFGGTGLGLAIVRNLAHALGGTVSVSSVVGEGSTFIVDLPLRLAQAPESASEPERDGETIVVLDRNPIVRGMLRTLFAPHFAAVQFSATIDEAIALARDSGPALILADEATLAASGDDPVEKLSELAAAAGADVRTAALWSKSDGDVEQRLCDTGVDLIIVKPVKGPALVAALTAGRPEICATSRRTTLVSQAA